ncbi:Uncharacterised protein [Pseudomonas aeruginosa]|nr:Uncharacterised protein [Pseudomonas aeruginosa]
MGRIAPAGQPRPEGRRQHRDRPQAAAHRAHPYLRAGPRRRLLQPDAPRHDEPGRPRCHRGGPAGQPGALPRSVGRPAGSPPGLSPAGQGQPRRQPAPAGCPRRQPPGGRCPRPCRALPEPGQPGRGAARRRRRGAVRRPFRCTALRRQRAAALPRSVAQRNPAPLRAATVAAGPARQRHRRPARLVGTARPVPPARHAAAAGRTSRRPVPRLRRDRHRPGSAGRLRPAAAGSPGPGTAVAGPAQRPAAGADAHLDGLRLRPARPGPDHVAVESRPEADPRPARRRPGRHAGARRPPAARPERPAPGTGACQPAMAAGTRPAVAAPAGRRRTEPGLQPDPAGHGPDRPASRRTAGYLAGPVAAGRPQPFRPEHPADGKGRLRTSRAKALPPAPSRCSPWFPGAW